MTARTYHKRGELIDGVSPGNHQLYRTWSNMLSRCTNPNTPNYPDYGGRGITVCQRWHHFKNFVSDVGPRPSKHHSLDRKNNDKGYSKSNCKWSTRKEQNANKRVYVTSKTGVSGIRLRQNRYQVRITIDGERKVIGQFTTLESAVTAKEIAIRKKNRRTKNRIEQTEKYIERPQN